MKNKCSTIALVCVFLLLCGSLLFVGGQTEGSSESKRITVYTTLDEPLAVVVFKAFTEETGIAVDFVRLSTGECVARL